MKGKIVGQWVVILIDSGSTHNFVDIAIANRSKFPTCTHEKVERQVANGEQLVNEGKGQRVIINI